MIAHYSHGFKNKQWYLRIFFQILNVALVNAWLLYKKKTGHPMRFLDFKASVASSLLTLGKQQAQQLRKKRGRPTEDHGEDEPPAKKRCAPPKVALEIRYDRLSHYPKKLVTTSAPRCHDEKCTKRSRYICVKCKEPVCLECMENFHTK